MFQFYLTIIIILFYVVNVISIYVLEDIYKEVMVMVGVGVRVRF